MAQKTMYTTIVGDPVTTLTAPYQAGIDTAVHLADTSFLPDPGTTGNTCTIWLADRTYLVTVRYTAKLSASITGVTVVQGYPQAAVTATFPIGSVLGKPLAQDDVQSIQDNIRDLDSAKVDKYQGTSYSGKYLKVGSDGYIMLSSGGGGSGTTDYDELDNRPQINSVTLTGNKTPSALGLQSELVSGTSIKTINSQSVLGEGNIQIDGVTDYEDLDNLPKINSIELTGNKSLSALGIQPVISSTAKLSADLVDDSSATNKFYHTHASTHALNGGDAVSIDASQVTSGIFSADRIPALAYQRMVTVADETAKSALTSADVNVGDTVYVQENNKLYIVSSITGKGTASEVINYVIYTAYVSWNSITGKPSTYTPSAHASSHTNGTDDIQTANTSQKGLLSSADWNTFNAKQSALTFDSTPTASSTNPVTSGGIKTAITTAVSNKVRCGTTTPTVSGDETLGDIYVKYS